MREGPGYFLSRLSVERPVTVVMALAALLVVGYITYGRIPINLVPEGLEAPWLGVWVAYPNASPVEVEKKIARPIEEALATLSRVGKIRSSSHSGGCWTSVQFQSGTDMDRAYAELRDRMDRAMPELPDEVERIEVRSWGAEDWPVMWMAVALPAAVSDADFILEDQLRPLLQRIEGVGTVEIWGRGRKQVQIEVDQQKVRSHHLALSALVRMLRRQNFTLSGGYVREGGRKIYVRSMGKFRSLEEIAALRIDTAAPLRLGDIAAVSLKAPRQEWFRRIDGKESLGLAIKAAAGANVVQVSAAVHAALERLKRSPRWQGFEYAIYWDQGVHVTESVDNLKNTGLWGGLFAALVLLFFLRALRMTLIITLAIPLSLLATVIALYFLGWSLNIATMMGLMLCLGLVVDNAIVIVENIHRKRQEGAAPRRAAIEGAGEVGLAVTTATLTTVVVFLPLMLMSDDEDFSFWMARIGLPVIIGLLASLAVALAVIPLAVQRLSGGGERAEPRILVRARNFYLRCLRWVLGHRIDATILVLLAMASVQIPLEKMKRTDQQQERRNDLLLIFDMPSGQSIEQADRFMRSVEDTLMRQRERYNIKTLETGFRRAYGELHLLFNEDEHSEWYAAAYDDLLVKLGRRAKPHLDYQEVVEDIQTRLALPPGVSLRINWRGGEQDEIIAINLYGEDTRVLVGLAREVERRLRTVAGLLSVYTDMERGNAEIQLRLDREQSERLGINAWEVAGGVAAALRGENLSRYQSEDGREIYMHIQLKEGDRRNIQQLRNLSFKSGAGEEIPLEALSSLYVTRTLGSIRREDRQTMLAVTARAAKDDARELFARIDQAMQGFEMPRGYRWDKGARYVRLEAQDQSQRFAVLMSVTFVFLLMGVLFESFVLPLSVIVAIPFSFLGVYWILYLSDTTFEIMAMIGSVILIGVVVNNAIVLIDLTNRLRAEGMERSAALMEAGRHRFRPILMTTFTTVCGLIPMAVGNSRMIGIPYAPMGRTMMGGLLASTVLTLVIVPLFYTFFDELREWMQRLAAAVLRPQKRPPV